MSEQRPERPTRDGADARCTCGHSDPPRHRYASRELTEGQEALLDLPSRHELYEQITRTPGLNKNQLGGKLGMHATHLDFHLERLEEAGLIVTKPSAQEREILCFLTEDEGLWEDPDTRILFGRSSIREIGVYLGENPGAATTDAAEAVGLAAMTVRHHVRTLMDHDLVRRVRHGRQVEYYPTPELSRWTNELGDLYNLPWQPDEDRGPSDGDQWPEGEQP